MSAPSVPPPTVRILHTSDIHVGDNHDGPAAVAALVDLALEHGVDAMLIVGDFFDHNRLDTAFGQSVVDQLERLPVPVVVLPTHVQLLTEPDGQTVVLADLDLEIWGRPHISYDDLRPLAGLPPRGAATWQLALAHGQLVLTSDDLRRAYQITPEEIAASERDYVALGHWDVPRDVTSGSVAASYSGSPSRRDVCALVTLSTDGNERRVVVESIAVGTRDAQ